MSLLPTGDTIGLDPATHEPFYWRGWHDRERTLDARTITLRLSNAGGSSYSFEGKPVAAICGRERPPFKLVPRYVDLFLYRTPDGTYVCHRRWVSEAYGEIPVFFTVVVADDLKGMLTCLSDYDPTGNAVTLWSEDDPLNAKRAKRAKLWLRDRYADRVARLLAAAAERE